MTTVDIVDIEIALDASVECVGRLHRHAGRRGETATFEYTDTWLASPQRFAIDPGLPTGRGTFAPTRGRSVGAAIGDTAPDSWGRRLMQRGERRAATREGRRVRTLGAIDFLLGVSDESRLGALRLRLPDEIFYRAQAPDAVPPLIEIGRLLRSTGRILRDEATDEDLAMMLAPGSSLGGARPKASVRDGRGRLSIAKFPKDDDEYSLETWEAIALVLARDAGIATPESELLNINGRAVLLSARFDRRGETRVPFISAMTLTDSVDGEQGSYPDIVDALSIHGANTVLDAAQLYRRVAFNVLASNVDDHLRNHGVLHTSRRGWVLAPAYDLNPVPADLKARLLSTSIDGTDATCSIELLLESAALYGLDAMTAARVIQEVACVTRGWRSVAARFGERPAVIERMASAFEHEALDQALGLTG